MPELVSGSGEEQTVSKKIFDNGAGRAANQSNGLPGARGPSLLSRRCREQAGQVVFSKFNLIANGTSNSSSFGVG